jgi:hypothetical protein
MQSADTYVHPVKNDSIYHLLKKRVTARGRPVSQASNLLMPSWSDSSTQGYSETVEAGPAGGMQ